MIAICGYFVNPRGVGRLNNGVRNPIGGQRIDGDRYMRGLVERQTAGVAGGQVRPIGQDGTQILGPLATHQRGFKIDLEMNQQRAWRGEEQGTGCRILNGSAAQGENQGIGADESRNSSVLSLTKCSLAILIEQLRNGAAGFSLDRIVHINEGPAQKLGDERTDGRLARAHKAGEHDAARK